MRAAILAALAFMIATTAPAAETLRPFKIAIEDYPPFEFVEAGKAKGIDVEVIRRIMERLDVPVEFEQYPWARAWLLLEKGKVDAVTSVSYQPFREPQLYFLDSQKKLPGDAPPSRDRLWTTDYVFFINRRFSDSLRFESYEQMSRNKYRVGVIKGYTYDQAFNDAALDRYRYPSQAEAFRALAEGIIDVLPFDRTIGSWILRECGMDQQLTFLPRALFKKAYLLGFGRASTYPGQYRLAKRFYDELQLMRRSGEYDAIWDTYMSTPPSWLQPHVFTFVCEDWAPFEYEERGQVKGIDVEVTERIMGRLGLPYRIEIYPWSRAWMMAEKGGADAVLSVSYKRSRESVLYYTEEQRAFAETGTIPPDYLWLSEYVFFVKRQNGDAIRFDSYEQLKSEGFRVGMNNGYSYHEAFVAADFDGPVYNDTEEGLLALVSGEIDLYPMDKTVGLSHLHELGLTDSVTYLEKPLFKKPYLAPFCKTSDYQENEKLMQAFNRELRLMRQSGEYKRIYDRHLEALAPAKPETQP